MANLILFTAKCPECQSVVAAATARAVAGDPKGTLLDWVDDGLVIEVADSARALERHKPECSIGQRFGHAVIRKAKEAGNG